MPRDETQWPHEWLTKEKGVIKFKPILCSIKTVVHRKKDNTLWGWKFKEDTTDDGEYEGKPRVGVVWGAPQAWNEAEQSFDPYEGPMFKQNQRVVVGLAATEKGERTYHNVYQIAPADPGAEAPAEPTPGETTGKPASRPVWERENSIIAQVAFKALTELLAAGKLPGYEKGPEDGPPTLSAWGVEWVVFYEAFKRGAHPVWPERVADPTVAGLPDGDPKDADTPW